MVARYREIMPEQYGKGTQIDWKRLRGQDLRPYGIEALDMANNRADLRLGRCDAGELAPRSFAVSWPRSYEVAGTSSMAYRAVAAAAQLRSRPAPPLPLRFSLLDGLVIGSRPEPGPLKKGPGEIFASRPTADEHRAAVGVFDTRVRVPWDVYVQRRACVSVVSSDNQHPPAEIPSFAGGAEEPDSVSETVPESVPAASSNSELPVVAVDVGPRVRRPLEEYPEDERRRIELKISRGLQRKMRQKAKRRLGRK